MTEQEAWFTAGRADAKLELAELMRKTREFNAAGRLAVVLAWLGVDTDGESITRCP